MRKLLKKRNNNKLKYKFSNPLYNALRGAYQEVVMDRRMARKATRATDVPWDKKDSGLEWYTRPVVWIKKLDGRRKVSTFMEVKFDD